ncbi:hypothetical protein GA0115240_1448103 [Streptomyces sp. DvalAA-14]|uniref:hypothetical protein n=1 Tax=unclassified Streptomyces TaxID=2593676 RepID=UPI00081B9CF0|nr:MULTISPECIES: hypothetical protein [unclassified Streptomyces]MYS22842.1 hypothetical protein [Streptomyces sp. SID4948]SCE23113.1 hypothetical protein GA0115240_1448103 [Streptomyces sp. DvalAA-14]
MPPPQNGDSIRSPRARARVVGIRSAVLVTLVAAGVAACVSAGSEPDPKPNHVPASAGSVADGPGGGRMEPAAGRPAGKNGMSPSPSASGTLPSAGASASASVTHRASGKPAGGRAVPSSAGGVTVPQPTAQASPTQQAPPPTTPAADPTTAAPTDPPSQSDSSPPGSPAPGGED